MASLLSCQTTNIPNVRFYAEIPFRDAPEGAYVESLTKKVGIVPADEWFNTKPYMICVDPQGKKDIFNQWAEACRWAGDDCNVQLTNVRKAIEAIDEIASKYIPLPKVQ